MACNYPVGTYRLNGEPCLRPCGYCIECRLSKARLWAIRCVHEAKMHDDNCFLTLTYNNENLPTNGSINKREVQLFMKRLRKKEEGKEIRYFACGEYGDKLGRPHYHILLFGHDFDDKVLLKRNIRFRSNNRFGKSDIKELHVSEKLSKLWKKGFHTIGDVTFESAGYCARYVTKKKYYSPNERRKGKSIEDYYKGKEPEFALMSRRPGIGKKWFDRYRNDAFPKDFITFRGYKLKPPRYYDMLYQRKDFEEMEKIKNKRREEEDLQPDRKRLWQKDKHKKIITKQLIREFERE